jgi:uncharacterized protein (TIGR02145 family)
MRKMLFSACVALAVLGCGGDDGDLPPCLDSPSCMRVYSKCGDQAYNYSTEYCDGSTVYPRCGNSGYNPSTEFCSDSTVYSKCDSSNYSPSTQFCFGNTIYSKCGGSDYSPSTQYCSNGTVKAYSYVTYQGQTYKTIVIGTQTWFAENLNYVSSSGTFISCNTYDCATYGRLYDWSTAMNFAPSCNYNSCSNQIQSPHQGICPEGWHIPSNKDWDKLYRYADGISGTSSLYDSPTAGKHLKSASGWNPYIGIENLDTYGFSALPGGYGNSDDSFDIVGYFGYWWSSDDENSYDAYRRHMNSGNDNARWKINSKFSLFSVRCVQDDEEKSNSSSAPSSSSSIGYSGSYGSVYYEGQTYKTVVIGNQTWFAENLNYVVEGSKCCFDNPTNCDTFGSLYDRSTAMGLPSSCNFTSCSGQIQQPHRGICPYGWHIPSRDEWETLSSYVESNSGCSNCDAYKLKATNGWASDFSGARGNGTDDYGFSALPGGHSYSNGNSYGVGVVGNWWSANEGSPWSMGIGEYAQWVNYGSNLYSVRCVQD